MFVVRNFRHKRIPKDGGKAALIFSFLIAFSAIRSSLKDEFINA